jgi:hypothetical protein
MIDTYAFGNIKDYKLYSNFCDLDYSLVVKNNMEDVIDIYVIYIGNFDLLVSQYKLLKKFSNFKFVFNVVNFGNSCELVKPFCIDNNINYLYVKKIFEDRTGIININYEASLVLNFIFYELFSKNSSRYFCLLHHDIAPISNIEIDYLYSDGMGSRPQFLEFFIDNVECGIVYPWVGMLFIDSLKFGNLDFRCGVSCINNNDIINKNTIEFDNININEFKRIVDTLYKDINHYSYKSMFEPGFLISCSYNDVYYEYKTVNQKGCNYNYYIMSRGYELLKIVDDVDYISGWSCNINTLRSGYIEKFGNWVHGIGLSNWYYDELSDDEKLKFDIKYTNFLKYLNTAIIE